MASRATDHMYGSEDYKDRTEFEEGSVGSEGNNRLDAKDMRRLGNRQELKRNFHSLAVLGLTTLLIQTWSGLLIGIPYSLINGGRAGSVWSYFGTWVFQFPLVASLAEMTSMSPSAAGQYGWISEFAPESIQQPLSYVSGWLSALGWQTIIAGTRFGVSGIILTMVSIAMPGYTPVPWHTTVLMICIGLVAVIFNIFAAKRMPLFEYVVLVGYIAGFLVIVIPLWIFGPRVPATEVFGTFENSGGWSSVGAACVLGQTAAASAFIGFDSAAHISEEVKNASVSVPRMMMAALVLNGALGFVMVITFCFVLQDIETQIIQSPSPFPWIGVFASATSSQNWALGMAAPLVLINISACINAVMAASRQLWSLARDQGLPFSPFFMKISRVSSTPIPVHAMLVSLCLLVIIALLNLASSKIISIIIGLLGGAIGTTYIISISCVLWRRLFSDRPLPPAKWSLGRFGVPINAVALAYQINATICGFFPVQNHVDVDGMNWSVVVFVGVAILCAVNYAITGRRKYKGPVTRILKDE